MFEKKQKRSIVQYNDSDINHNDEDEVENDDNCNIDDKDIENEMFVEKQNCNEIRVFSNLYTFSFTFRKPERRQQQNQKHD